MTPQEWALVAGLVVCFVIALVRRNESRGEIPLTLEEERAIAGTADRYHLDRERLRRRYQAKRCEIDVERLAQQLRGESAAEPSPAGAEGEAQ